VWRNDYNGASQTFGLFHIYYHLPSSKTETEFVWGHQGLYDHTVSLKQNVFLKPLKVYLNMTANSGLSEYTGGVAKTVSMFSKLMNQGSALVVEGVKNFVLKENKLPITRIVDHLMELKNSEETKEYLYFDSKLLRPSDGNLASARTKTPFQDAVVFVVGGGNYMEYANLSSYAKNKTGASIKRVIYGCTDVVNAEQFINQVLTLQIE
ncbi:unnamed protein product, partial [Meganyctiphanes norvegica]